MSNRTPARGTARRLSWPGGCVTLLSRGAPKPLRAAEFRTGTDQLSLARAIATAAAAVCVLGAPVARAQVIEIGPGGSVTTFDGPSVHVAGAARSIREVMGLDAEAPATLRADPASSATLRAPAHVRPLVEAAAARHGLAPALLDAVAHQESRFRQEAVSHKGAIGVMQLMPGTARALGVDPHDKIQNLDGGARYLRAMLDRFGGDVTLALAAYNAGPGAVERHRGVPPFRETQDYVRRIRADLDARAPAAAPSGERR